MAQETIVFAFTDSVLKPSAKKQLVYPIETALINSIERDLTLDSLALFMRQHDSVQLELMVFPYCTDSKGEQDAFYAYTVHFIREHLSSSVGLNDRITFIRQDEPPRQMHCRTCLDCSHAERLSSFRIIARLASS